MKLLDRILGRSSQTKPPVKQRGSSPGPRAWRVERDSQIREERANGAKTSDLAAKYGLSKFTILAITKGVARPPQTFGPRGPQCREIAERNVAMLAAYERGEKTLQSLGDKYGVTRERVRQILEPTGVTALIKEQHRIQRDAAQSHANEIKAALRGERERVLAEGTELVRQGSSIWFARRALEKKYPGILPTGAFCVSLACKQAGVETKHGRWRDNQPKINRVRELRATGMSWNEIDQKVNAEDLGHVTGNWVARHCPELVRGHGPNPNAANGFACGPPVKTNSDIIWTDEIVRQLKTLWFNGSTGQQCSEILGTPFTRSAILGKIGRLRRAGEWKP